MSRGPGGEGDAGGGAQQGTASRYRKRKFNTAFWAREPGKYSRVIPGTVGTRRKGDGRGEELGRLVVSCFSHQTASLRARRDFATQGIDLIPSQLALLALIVLLLGVSPPRSPPTGPMFHSGFALRRREVRPSSVLRVLGRVYWAELSGVRTRTAPWANLRWCQPFCRSSPCTSPFPLRA